MLRRLGYLSNPVLIPAITNRTCRLRNATPDRLRALITANLDGLQQVLAYNLGRQIDLYRISSQLIPFASHPDNPVPWWEAFDTQLAEIGAAIRQHDVRVSLHPGHFTVLNSVRPDVVDASIRELAWHARLLDTMGLDATHKIVIHVGGTAGGELAASSRFVSAVNQLPDRIRRRLVVEHDERHFSARAVLTIAEQVRLPVVFDWLHHHAHPDGETDVPSLLNECFRTWRAPDGIPKVHLSSQDPHGPPRKHADSIAPADALALIEAAPAQPFDCMVEAKGKDRALFELRAALQQHGIVERAH